MAEGCNSTLSSMFRDWSSTAFSFAGASMPGDSSSAGRDDIGAGGVIVVARSEVHSRQFMGFLLVSGIAGAVNFGSRFLFSMGMPYVAAICSAFLVGLTTAFLLNRRFIFVTSAKSTGTQAFRFMLVNLVALVQTLFVSLLLANWVLPAAGWTLHSEAVAHFLGIAAPAVTSYLAHKHWTFQ